MEPSNHEAEATTKRFYEVFTFTIVPLIYLSTNGSKLSNNPNNYRLNTAQVTPTAHYEYNISIHIQKEEPMLLGLGPHPRGF